MRFLGVFLALSRCRLYQESLLGYLDVTWFSTWSLMAPEMIQRTYGFHMNPIPPSPLNAARFKTLSDNSHHCCITL